MTPIDALKLRIEILEGEADTCGGCKANRWEDCRRHPAKACYREPECTRAAQPIPQEPKSWDDPTTHEERLVAALTLMTGGVSVPRASVTRWVQGDDNDLQQWICQRVPHWAQGIVAIEAAEYLAGTPTEGVGHEFKDGRAIALVEAERAALIEKCDTLVPGTIPHHCLSGQIKGVEIALEALRKARL